MGSILSAVNRPARDAAALASRGLPSLLALEIQELRRTAIHLGRVAGGDPALAATTAVADTQADAELRRLWPIYHTLMRRLGPEVFVPSPWGRRLAPSRYLPFSV